MLEKNLEKKWLVKSENKILGPYHFDQIEDLLKKKQISLIDEIRDMDTRWLYIRENPSFKKVVDEIRRELENKMDSTKTYQSSTKPETSAVTNTTGNTANKTNFDLPQFTEVDVQEASVVNETHEENSQNQNYFENPTQRERAKIYGLPQDQLFQNKVQTSKTRYLIYLFAFITLAVGAGYSFVYYQKRSVRIQEEALMAQVRKFEFFGYNQKAVALYAKLPEYNQRKVLPEILSLYPILESEQLTNVKEIERIRTNSDLNVEQKTTIQIIYFLAALQNQNMQAASEALIKARSLQPASAIVLENRALLDLKNSEFKNSFDGFVNLYKTEKNGRYLVGALQALAGLTTEQKSQAIPLLSQSIESHTSTYYDFKKELLLGQMALARWIKNEILFKVSWDQFLNTPTQFANLFTRPTLLPLQIYQWKDLEEYKITVRTALNAEDSVLFEIHNYLEGAQVSAANKYAENNLPKIKDKAVKQQLRLLILNSQGRKNEILALEKTNQLNMSSEINHLLLVINKLEVNPQADISTHLSFFKERQLVFYHHWIKLMQILKSKQIDRIRPFLREHLITVNNFIPVTEARSLTE